MNSKTSITVTAFPVFLLFAAIIASPVLLSDNVAYAQHVSGPAGTTFPPPVFYTIRGQPSYEISIPFGGGERSMFEPHYVNIPVGMTVIWFNNDDGEHSVTTLTNNTYSPPQTIDSGTISADGGSFIHQFNTPGRYVYFDQYDPSMHGVINVGAAIEIGKYFNMHVGGINTIPFNPNKLRSVVLSFVPKTVTFPPVSDITYNITLLNSTGNALYSHTYLTSDGILDLELVPAHKSPLSSSSATISKNPTAMSPAQQFTTWGPDFIGQVPTATTGTFHIKGPVLIQNSPYSIKVLIVGKDNRIFPSPISETFLLPPSVSK